MGWEDSKWERAKSLDDEVVANEEIEERFLSTQADAFAGSEREENASACSARNDRLVLRMN
jgi:hypothetical protein